MKFAHMGDCHLGGWRQLELRELNFKSFQTAIDKCIKEKVDFVLITGDLFDSAYPSIETLKEAFYEFRKLKEAGISVYLIAGSHDYSVSGKTFLDVLGKAGLCKNVFASEEKDGKIILLPTIHKNAAIYGYPGKKSGLEIEEIERIKLQDSPGLFKILMLHTPIKGAMGNIPTRAVDETKLPKVNYLALGHLHINYNRNGMVYCGPIFPNSLSELEELKNGSFYIINTQESTIRREELKLKEVVTVGVEINDAFTATEKILMTIEELEIKDKIVILRVFGMLERGNSTDIDFQRIEANAKKRGAFIFLKSTNRLHLPEPEIKIEVIDSKNLEEEIIKKYGENNPDKFKEIIPELIQTLQIEKLEDEKSSVFEDRVISESKRILKI